MTLRCAFALTFASVSAWAQPVAVPQLLGYQGRLLHADGTPASGLVAMRFALFDDPGGGTALWSEDQSVAMTDGFYSTFLGSVTPIPDGVLGAAELHLEVSVDGTPLEPRQRVGSVAYARVAALAGGLSCSGCVGDGAVSSVSWSKVSGVPAAVTAPESDPTVNSLGKALLSCNAGDVPTFDGSGWLCVSGQEIDPNVNALGRATLACASNDFVVFDGASWQHVSGNLRLGAGEGDMHETLVALSADGAPTVAFTTHRPDDTHISFVRTWDGSSWHGLAGPGDTGQIGDPTARHTRIYDLVIDDLGRPIVVWSEDFTSGACQWHLARFEATDWVSLSPPRASTPSPSPPTQRG